MSDALLSVRDLTIEIETGRGTLNALDRAGFDIGAGEIVGIVGESGSGKSVSAHAIMGILTPAAQVTEGEIIFAGQDVLRMSNAQRDRWRGAEASMIFQSPRAALNPIRRVGDQLADVIARHQPVSPAEARQRAIEALRQVRIPDPERRLTAYPYELSGGQCQRVGIALALACAPRLLIADEPTTGLDVTTQAAVMDLIRSIAQGSGLAVALITHDITLAAEYCDRLIIIHAGQVVETGPTLPLIAAPRHPYTQRLLRSVPSAVASLDDLLAVEGAMPDLTRDDLPPCRFADRCTRRLAVCDTGPIPLAPVGDDHRVACRNPL